MPLGMDERNPNHGSQLLYLAKGNQTTVAVVGFMFSVEEFKAFIR